MTSIDLTMRLVLIRNYFISNSPSIAGTDQYPENGLQVVKNAIWHATKPTATYTMMAFIIVP